MLPCGKHVVLRPATHLRWKQRWKRRTLQQRLVTMSACKRWKNHVMCWHNDAAGSKPNLQCWELAEHPGGRRGSELLLAPPTDGRQSCDPHLANGQSTWSWQLLRKLRRPWHVKLATSQGMKLSIDLLQGDRAAHVLYEHAEEAGLDLLQAVCHRRDAVLHRKQRHEEQQHLRVPLRLAVLQPAARNRISANPLLKSSKMQSRSSASS